MRRRTSAKKYYDRLSKEQKEKLREIETLATSLMREYGVDEYQFKFGHARRYVGCCHYNSKTIRLDINFCLLSTERMIRNTMLHEIAHALVGSGHGHRKVWQDKARELGVTWTIDYKE